MGLLDIKDISLAFGGIQALDRVSLSVEPGELYAVLEIVLPPADSEMAKKLYADMARELAFDPRSRFGA